MFFHIITIKVLPDVLQAGTVRHYRVIKNLKRNKVYVKIISLETTFKTVLVGSRTDISKDTGKDT